MHVGMNIEDKATLIAEMTRVTRPGGTVLVYDLMRVGEGDLGYPMPWASSADFSFVDRPAVYEQAAQAAGLVVVDRLDFGDLARNFFDPPKDAPVPSAASAPPKPPAAGDPGRGDQSTHLGDLSERACRGAVRIHQSARAGSQVRLTRARPARRRAGRMSVWTCRLMRSGIVITTCPAFQFGSRPRPSEPRGPSRLVP